MIKRGCGRIQPLIEFYNFLHAPVHHQGFRMLQRPHPTITAHPFGLGFNLDQLSTFKRRRKKTFIISGSERGGTSMVAYALRCGNVNFGDAREFNHEPTALVQSYSYENTKELVTKLHKTSRLAGIKFPGFAPHFHEVQQVSENTLSFFVFRNPLSTACSICSRQEEMDLTPQSLEYGLQHSHNRYAEFIRTASKFTRPVIAVKYEVIQHNPRAFIRYLEELGVRYEKADLVAQEIAVPSYKSAPSKTTARRFF